MAALHKTSKKRAAPSQAGSKTKKTHIEGAKPEQKRSRPITQPLVSEDPASDSDAPSDNAEDEGLELEDIAEATDDVMEVELKQDLLPKDPNGVSSTLFMLSISYSYIRCARIA